MKKNILDKVKQVRNAIKQSLTRERLNDLFIFSFFFAISGLFWFIQELDENFGADLIVPVKLVGIPKNAHITNDLPSDIRITVQDKGGELLPYLFSKYTDTLRIQFKSNGDYESGYVSLQRDTLATLIKRLLPTMTEITSITPGNLYYSYFTGAPTRLPIRLDGNIETDAQFYVDYVKFEPDSVDVYASKEITASMKAIYTEKFDTSRLTENFEKTLLLKKQHDVLIDCEKTKMRIVLGNMIREEIELPIIGINFPGSKTLRAFPSTVKVIYYVPEKLQKTIDTDEFKVTITYADLIENKTGRCIPRLNSQPSGVLNPRIDPTDVGYLIENVESTESTEPKHKKR